MARKAKTPTPEELENQARYLRVMEEMPDSQKVDPFLAAIFLDVSEKTLARWRQGKKKDDGTETGPLGPRYAQLGIDVGVEAQNQGVKYEMGKLRKYFASMEVSTSMEGAVKRGLAFITLSDCLLQENPFWIKIISTTVEKKSGVDFRTVRNSSEVIVGGMFNVSEDQLRGLIADPQASIRNLSLDEAMKMPWADPEARQPFNKAYVKVLQQSLDASNGQQEAAELRVV